MWGCSRSALLRRGLALRRRERLRWYSSSQSAGVEEAGATPVSEDEFLGALVRVMPQARWETQKQVGLAISGGVDSMTLAQLYSRLAESQRKLPKAHGIIIDHKARSDSTEEAQWVADQLKTKLDISSTIVPLAWSKEYDFSNPSSFESDARRLRYQALGLTCKAHGITSLLVAHHGDDQAETILMRMMKARLRTGLQGMQAQEWIPECHGMYGIHHSGTPIESKALPFPIESGGIRLLRPLLTFEKERLIATCRLNDMPWTEDPTNTDPTLTSRNAIRHIMSTSTLPQALSKPALINLAQRMQHRVQTHKDHADKIFNNTPIELNIQLGAVAIQFPPWHVFLTDPNSLSQPTTSELNAARNTAHIYLNRIADLVTPKENNSIGELETGIDTIWPELRTEGVSRKHAADFCVFGLMFRPDVSVAKFPAPRTRAHRAKVQAGPYPPVAKFVPRKYLITRQPPGQQEPSTTSTSFVVPANTTTPTPFHLFDNRFWISLTNHSPNDLHVRFLNANDMRIMAEEGRKYFQLRKNVLGGIKPVEARATIPAVFMRWREGLAPKEELVALPTFDAGIKGVGEICSWEVRYRKVNLEERNLGNVVTGREKWIGGAGRKPVQGR